ncbi:hypothetical protein [Kocuria arenosa]|uniref:hypothetical protein n=1 Tax=Kocuria arenosa TaxID=3071446 RepID=UPI0034D410FD
MTVTATAANANIAAEKALAERGEDTGVATEAGAKVYRTVGWSGKTHYGMRVVSPRSAGNGMSVTFSWTEDPEFRVSDDGFPAIPTVVVGRDTVLSAAPKYVQAAVAEVLERVAAVEQNRHRTNPRTPAQHELIGPYITREQYGQVEHLANEKLDHRDRDRATVLAVLRAALEDDWATPEEKTDLESERDDARGELEGQKPQLEHLGRLRTAAEVVQEESGRFLARFEPTGLRPDSLSAAHCEIVVDEARYFDEALGKLASVVD